jgi:hypothetical protein
MKTETGSAIASITVRRQPGSVFISVGSRRVRRRERARLAVRAANGPIDREKLVLTRSGFGCFVVYATTAPKIHGGPAVSRWLVALGTCGKFQRRRKRTHDLTSCQLLHALCQNHANARNRTKEALLKRCQCATCDTRIAILLRTRPPQIFCRTYNGGIPSRKLYGEYSDVCREEANWVARRSQHRPSENCLERLEFQVLLGRNWIPVIDQGRSFRAGQTSSGSYWRNRPVMLPYQSRGQTCRLKAGIVPQRILRDECIGHGRSAVAGRQGRRPAWVPTRNSRFVFIFAG